ncbi:acyl-CoA dehydrogenase family protein [Ilumatobacter coccineus]|uniref:Putative acyl-CoA dehydrogenase n=1 Tax=Ilumatobacter coccineus (strain NBRC 103263 / KCTC 29153 / YM16-304) TaxID=1313172 RepID=A0A6C7ECL1_ILUCY|nr:acyl-CoA dehydrogenase family protein [Ilumatobacter coccineus]BAN02865.1 putative acyl-CoA dehydrogenase [Ilumatobacter coccineus YM16-304]
MTTIDAETDLTADEQRVSDLITDLLEQFPPNDTDAATFLGQQFDRGLAWVHFPEGNGGLGLNPKLQRMINERLQAAGAPNAMIRNPIGHGMCGPTVVTWGSDDQKSRYLRPMFTGEEVWCQLFSEPGSGSDFAGLSSTGVRDGDEWICNGQKVWTTLAHLSRWGLLVVRTDPQAVKHAGLTAFVVDMQDPTVEVRPLRQMTGEAEFNEVFFTDTRIHESEMLGSPGDGWRVSLTTLMNERVSIGGTIPAKGSGMISALTKAWAEAGDHLKTGAALDEVMSLWSRAEVARLTNIRSSQNRKMGDPGPEGSIGKMAAADLNKEIYEKVMDLMGADALLYGSYEMIRPETAMGSDTPQKAFLRVRANSIEGGTSEVMRNILGERVLGLPGDVRVDREVPWSEIPRN